MPDIQPVNTTYEPFSREPEYIEANRAFIARQPLTHVQRFLDLACGTGTVSELLLGSAPQAHLNGIDYDPVQIDLATEHFRELGYAVKHGFELTEDRANQRPVLVFAVGSADVLPFPENTFDSVTIANAIHMMPDKAKFFSAIQRVLKPGGVFGFNSGFYAGAYPKNTESHTYEWLKAEGKPPIKRKHGTTRGAFQNRWLNPQEWCALLSEHGLKPHDCYERTVMLDERCLATMGAYGGLAEVVMSGYPVEESSEALQATAGMALARMGLDKLPRNWLEVWDTKI